MHRTLKIIFISAVALFVVFAAPAKEVDITEKQLRKLERTMLDAHEMLDFSKLEDLYAEEYTYIGLDGTMHTKRQVVEMVKTASLYRVDSIVSNPRIRVFGTAAVITGMRKFYREGRLLATARYTEVWVNRNKRWQCVSGQLTPIQEKK